MAWRLADSIAAYANHAEIRQYALPKPGKARHHRRENTVCREARHPAEATRIQCACRRAACPS